MTPNSLKTAVRELLKNARSKRFKQQYLLFSVDDFGNVRNHSPESRASLTAQGLPPVNKFDRFDALETKEDLHRLFDVLSKHKDDRGRSMVMTPYSVSANVDFERTLAAREYVAEPVNETFQRLALEQPAAYEGAWDLWKEGQQAGWVAPQFHGKEHLNVAQINASLRAEDADLEAMLRAQSLVGWANGRSGKRRWSVAYSFDERSETEHFLENVRDGLDLFEKVYGYRATAFTPPSQTFQPSLLPGLGEMGLLGIDSPLYSKRADVDGKIHTSWAFNGFTDKKSGLRTLVRNAVFEPVQDKRAVQVALNQVEWALKMGNVAHLSSHRLNFSGHIDPENGQHGTGQLDVLLGEIKKRWPAIHFISVAEYLTLVS